MRIDNPSISGSLSFIGGTNSISATSVSLTGSLSGTFEGAFSSTATANISGAFDSVSASLASERLKNTTDTLTGDLTVTGKITAQEFHTEFVSASIIYESGSTKFGNSNDDVHSFTGSISIQGGGLTSGTDLLSSATAYTIGTVSDSNIEIGTSAAGTPRMIFRVNGNNERMRIDSSGNVGIGTTPAAWTSAWTSIDVGGNSGFSGALYTNAGGTTGQIGLAQNWFYDGTNNKYINSAAASDYFQFGGNHIWRTAESGTAGNNISFSEAMRITSAGNVGIGTSSPAYRLDVEGDASFIKGIQLVPSESNFYQQAGALSYYGVTNGVYLNGAGADGFLRLNGDAVNDRNTINIYGSNIDIISFKTAASERMRIDSSGNVGIGETNPSVKLHIVGPNSDTSGNYYSQIKIKGTGTYPNNIAGLSFENAEGQQQHIRFVENGSTKFQIRYNEGAATTNKLNFYSFITNTDIVTFDGNNGNVGIGTSSPSPVAAGRQILAINGSGRSYLTLQAAGTDLGYLYAITGNKVELSSVTALPLVFSTNNTERMRIDSSGNVLIGKTTTLDTAAGVSLWPSGYISSSSSASTNASVTMSVYSTSAQNYRFYVGYGGTVFAVSTAISAISDVRLKENIQDLTGGLDAVMSLKPKVFDWKAKSGNDGKGVRGFIAQEVEEVFPEYVDEYKTEELPEDGVPYKSVRQDFIPFLVSAIQELKAEIETLKSQINA